ncbi:MAG: ankyrin repeat domain-containing protein [Sedimentisphaerales bacterium]|nr:ankyrin repeat domain-containing protein [Sedimentisphaerales bacterium]
MKVFAAVCLFVSFSVSHIALPNTDGSSGQLSGVISGMDVVLKEVVFADKILRIKTKGKDGFEARLSVHLPIENGVIPELRKFSEDDKTALTRATFRNRINVMYSWTELASGKDVGGFMKRGDFQIELEFDGETEKGIGGRLLLKNAGLGVDVAGSFIAEIRGLRLVDGHPDLQCDHRDTLAYAAELFLRKELKLEAVKLTDVTDFRCGLDAGNKKAGWLDGEYKGGEGEAVFVRLQFLKEDEGWRVFRRLRADQLVEAHPIVPFDAANAKDDEGITSLKFLDFLTAGALEADLQKEHPRKGFSANIGSRFAFNEKTGIGSNSTYYTFHGEKGRLSRTYLLRKVGEAWRVERALEEGEKVNTKTGKVERFIASGGKTLCEAAAKGDAELVGTLLEKGADVNAKDTKGIPPIVHAAAGGYEEIVKMLVGRGADVDTSADDGIRALYISVARGDSGIAELLVKAKAEINLKNGHGSTALHTAAVWDRTEIADMLIDAGANINAIDEAGNSPLDFALWWGSDETARLLKGGGAKTVSASDEIPELMGRVHGMDIIGGDVTIDAGRMLSFHGSRGSVTPPEVSAFLGGVHGIVPVGRSFKFDYSDGFSSSIAFRFYAEGRGNQHHDYLKREDYELELTFGDEDDGILEGKILLNAPGKDVRLKGTFRAKLRGLRIIDGHPDLRSDSFETLQYAIKLYLRKKLGREDVQVSSAAGSYSQWFNSDDRVGGADVHYKENDSERFLRAQLRKGGDGWHVVGELKGNELFAAHPLIEVNKDDQREYFLYLVAQRLEKELQEKIPGGAFRTDLGVMRRLSRKHQMAEARLGYWITGTDKKLHRRYLLRQVGDDWVVERMLNDDEKLNTSTGKIEKN